MTAPVSASATPLLANIPSPDQGVWYLGPVPLRAYALCIIVGIVVAILWGDRRWRARGGRAGTVTDIAVFAVPFGLVGGRLYHVATDWYKYFGPGRNPVDALKVWEGGLGIWGAVALGAVGAWIGCRRRGVPLTAFADAVAPGLVLAQAIGRLGNWFNQELYGAPTNLPWGLEIYRRVDPDTKLVDPIAGVAIDHTPVEVVHPTFLYELLWNIGVVLLIVWADRKFRLGHGRAFALYVAGYTAGRTWIELMRTDDATLILGVRINVFTSLVLFALAVIYLLLVRGGREDPELVRGKPLPGDDDYEDARAGGADADSAASRPADAQQDADSGGSSSGSGDSAGTGTASSSGSESEKSEASASDSADEDADSGSEGSGSTADESAGSSAPQGAAASAGSESSDAKSAVETDTKRSGGDSADRS